MIDLHSHILAGLDDGAKNDSDSIELLKAAVADGISFIYATPHHQNGRFENEWEQVLRGVGQLNKIAKKNNLPVEVLPGQEIRLYGEIIEDFKKGKIKGLGGNTDYLLIEFSSSHIPRFAERLFYEMGLEGLKPIIVHPERNAEFLKYPEKLLNFVEKGALVQLTAASILGIFGKKIQKFSFRIIGSEAAHFIASDAHNIHTRGFKMQEAFKLVEKRFGSECKEGLLENAKSIKDGKTIFPPPPSPLKREGFLNFFIKS